MPKTKQGNRKEKRFKLSLSLEERVKLMKMGSKADKNELTEKQRKNKSKAIKALVATVVAGCIFFGLLIIMTSVLNQEETTKVYKAKSDLISGTKIGTENFEDYFYEDYEETAKLPSGSVTDLSTLNGKFIVRDLYENEVITSNNTGTLKESITEGMQSPIKLSFQVANVPASVAGEIREGDLINIYTTSSVLDVSTGENVATVKLVAANVYVKGAYQSDGTYLGKTTTISNEDSSENVTNGSVAMMFNIIVPQAFEQEFILQGVTGDYYITKVLDVEAAKNSIFGYDSALVGRSVVSDNEIQSGGVSANDVSDAPVSENSLLDMSSLELETAEVVNGELNINVKDSNGKTYAMVIEMDTKCEKGLAEKLSAGQLEMMEKAFDKGVQNKDNWKDYLELFKQYSAEVGYTLE